MKIKYNQIKEQGIFNVLFQFVKFGIVGISNTLISLGIYYLLTLININYLIANTAGFFGGTFNAYYWNNKYVFKKKENEKRSIVQSGIKVFLSYGITYLISTFLLYLFVDILCISKIVAPIIGIIFTTPLNFLLNKLWAFKCNDKEVSKYNE